MAHNKNLFQDTPQNLSTFWRNRRRYTHLVFVIALTVLCGLTLTGCQDFWDTTAELIRLDDDEAEAQDQTETRVVTYVINTDGFEIVLDNQDDLTPELDLNSDESTRLTMRSEGSLVRGTGDSNVALENGDIIIIRLNGTTGSATLIRND